MAVSYNCKVPLIWLTRILMICVSKKRWIHVQRQNIYILIMENVGCFKLPVLGSASSLHGDARHHAVCKASTTSRRQN